MELPTWLRIPPFINDEIGHVWVDRLPRADANDHNAVALDVPGYIQMNEYCCGFAAGLSVLHYFYPAKSDKRFFKRVSARPDSGCSAGQLKRALRESNLVVRSVNKLDFEKIAELLTQTPILTTIEYPGAATDHWVVIYGFARKPKRVYLLNNRWKQISTEYDWAAFRDIWISDGAGIVCNYPEAD